MYEVELHRVIAHILQPRTDDNPYGVLERGFYETTTKLGGRLLLPVMPSVDQLGLSIRIDAPEIPKSHYPTGSLIEAIRIFEEDELAISAITTVFTKHFGPSHATLQDSLGRK